MRKPYSVHKMSKEATDIVTSVVGACTTAGSVAWAWIGDNSSQITVIIGFLGFVVNVYFGWRALKRKEQREVKHGTTDSNH